VVEGDMVSWTKTFPDLDTPVLPNTVFAINVPDEYGEYFKSAATYNKENGTNYDPKAAIPYTFDGRFVVSEDNKPGEEYVYTGLNSGKNLLNNVYPCNLDAKLIESMNLGSVSVYDYENGSFVSTDATGSDVVTIKAQQGFVFTPKAGTSFTLTDAIMAEGSTRTRSIERPLPTFSLSVDNANTTDPGASNVVLKYDEQEVGFYNATLNTPKTFTRNLYTPEAYIISNDAYYSRLYVGAGVTKVPLGIALRRAMNVTFQQVYNEGFTTMILVDEQTGKEYDLLTRSYTTDKLAKGTTEGRFYLKFAVDVQDDNQDDDFTTDIEDALTEQASINIYAVDNSTVRVLGNNTELQQIYVSDMAGRTMRYDASGNFAELQLPVSQGVYLVQVIADNVTRTEKVVIK
ncbi:MAG: T9SS type A sorting domain-containing protein, partial [Paludibacteraceae bacterium]|nr:T9SS type A sorting domain-containing protein [Paludibacteraceae bacterium]